MPIPSRSELGPLWNEKQPKLKGFRVAIPDPQELYLWIQGTAHASGEKTRKGTSEEVQRNFYKLITGQTEKELQNQRLWRVDILDDLINNVEMRLEADYSQISGTSGSALFAIEYANIALLTNSPYQVASLAPEIAQILNTHNFGKVQQLKEDGDNIIQITDQNSNSKVTVRLGVESLEEALSVRPDYQTTDSNCVFIYPSGAEFPGEFLPMLSTLKLLQRVASHTIDAMYEALGKEPPDITLDISQEKELS